MLNRRVSQTQGKGGLFLKYALMSIGLCLVPSLVATGWSWQNPPLQGNRTFLPLNVQNSVPPFDVNEVIEKASAYHRLPMPADSAFLIDKKIIYMPASGRMPFVAFNGTNHFVAWYDRRNQFPMSIYGARINPSGVILDTAGICINGDAGNGFGNVAISAGTTNSLVTYWNNANYGIRINHNGRPLDQFPISIGSGGNFYGRPQASAFDGTNYMVVYVLGTHDIYGCRIDSLGRVLDTLGIRITNSGNAYEPAIAFDGTNYFVVWKGSGIYGARVTRSGVVLDPNGIPISTSGGAQQQYPWVGFGRTNYLVSWEDYRNGNWDIYFARVTRSGTVLDPLGIPLTTNGSNQMEASISFDGTNYFITCLDRWISNDDLYGVRVTQTGTVLDTNGIFIAGGVRPPNPDMHYFIPTTSFSGSTFLVVWEARMPTPTYEAIYGARVDTTGQVLGSFLISQKPYIYQQNTPSCAYDGTNYILVWEDYRNFNSTSSSDIYGCRVNAGGAILDTNCILIGAAGNDQKNPTVSFDGTNYFVVWEDYRNGSTNSDIYGTRITTSGIVIDTPGIAVSTAANNQGAPKLAFDGTNYLIAWHDYRSGINADIYGARVTRTGNVLDPSGIPISLVNEGQWYPSVAFGDTNYLVTWQDVRSANDMDIYGTRVSPAGIVLDTAGILITGAPFDQTTPCTVFDGINYFIAWRDGRSGGFSDIYGSRLTQAGTVLDPNGIAISVATNNQSSPNVIFDGSNYDVIWQDYRNRPDTADIYGCRINSAGVVLDPAGLPISTRPGNQLTPAIAKGSGNQTLVTYSGFVDSISGQLANTMRIWGKFYSFSPSGNEEERSFKNLKAENSGLELKPNPFNQSINIRFWTSENEKATLKVYDATGRCVKTLWENQRPDFKVQSFSWTGVDELGRNLPGGVYFLRFEHGAGCETRKVILIR